MEEAKPEQEQDQPEGAQPDQAEEEKKLEELPFKRADTDFDRADSQEQLVEDMKKPITGGAAAEENSKLQEPLIIDQQAEEEKKKAAAEAIDASKTAQNVDISPAKPDAAQPAS